MENKHNTSHERKRMEYFHSELEGTEKQTSSIDSSNPAARRETQGDKLKLAH